MKKKMQILVNGIFKENPVLILVLGTCPTLAQTGSVISALGMGIGLSGYTLDWPGNDNLFKELGVNELDEQRLAQEVASTKLSGLRRKVNQVALRRSCQLPMKGTRL